MASFSAASAATSRRRTAVTAALLASMSSCASIIQRSRSLKYRGDVIAAAAVASAVVWDSSCFQSASPAGVRVVM